MIVNNSRDSRIYTGIMNIEEASRTMLLYVYLAVIALTIQLLTE